MINKKAIARTYDRDEDLRVLNSALADYKQWITAWQNEGVVIPESQKGLLREAFVDAFMRGVVFKFSDLPTKRTI
jgi:hypothetical protein